MIEWFCILLLILLACEKLIVTLIYCSYLIEMKILNVYSSQKGSNIELVFETK